MLIRRLSSVNRLETELMSELENGPWLAFFANLVLSMNDPCAFTAARSEQIISTLALGLPVSLAGPKRAIDTSSSYSETTSFTQ
jgi:hypothetical protein